MLRLQNYVLFGLPETLPRDCTESLCVIKKIENLIITVLWEIKLDEIKKHATKEHSSLLTKTTQVYLMNWGKGTDLT